jgi:hypothetical protein
VEKRFLLNWISTDGGNIAIFESVKSPTNVLSGGAKAQLALRNYAMPFASIALHPIPLALVKSGFPDAFLGHIDYLLQFIFSRFKVS